MVNHIIEKINNAIPTKYKLYKIKVNTFYDYSYGYWII